MTATSQIHESSKPSGLARAHCLQRQQRLRQHLVQQGLDGALLTDIRYIHYFTGHWQGGPTTAALFIPTQGPVTLVTARPVAAPVAADVSTNYPHSHYSTLVNDQPAAAIGAILPAMQHARRLGCDQGLRPWLLGDHQLLDLGETLLALRRTKDEDEIALIRRAISGCEAAYAEAQRILAPGVSEMHVYTRIQAAAIEAVGEPIGEFGNDFQSAAGGPPRLRAVEAGELMPLDLSVLVRGYWSDLCRTFCIGRQPTAGQIEARKLVLEAQNYVAQTARAGVSCKKLFHNVQAMLDGKNGWSFRHHLGHGIGLAPHEPPRLNPEWDDVLQPGDVFTCEPGLYGRDLRNGIRIEEDYLVTPSGLERLSSFPTDF